MNPKAKKGVKRAAKGFAIFVGFFWIYTKVMWPNSFTDAPEILANLYAKELCTCRYVVEQSIERCFENHEVITRPGLVEWDEEGQAVKVRVLWAHGQARVISPRLGCMRTASSK